MGDTAVSDLCATSSSCALLRQASTSSLWVWLLLSALVIASWIAASRSARLINQYQHKLTEDASVDAQHLTAHSRFG